MKKEKIYLSGKISGRDREEYLTQFADAEKHLRQLGYKVCNPTKALPCRFLWIYKLLGYKLTLIYDLWLLSRCDKICNPIYVKSVNCYFPGTAIFARLRIDDNDINTIKQ